MNRTGYNRKVNVKAKERQAEALRLRSQGCSYREIAARLGYAGPSGAYKSVTSALKAVQAEGVAELRTLHSLRLSELVACLWPRVIKGDPTAARAVLGALQREASLYGLDAPTRYEIDSFLRSDDWARIKSTLQRALKDHPEALASVIEALRGIGDE